ncbi:right-handed parallel beta-helix repeat-containing protein [Cronobacter sakazakii]|uniref:right-handed parallel beta-helix repeat-containing protein n=2 Tax=Cronobacter sakazakii TaxID=28141 RepID=UPI0013754A7D|nr:right-handed parallel beta-helix repeat-containing protein [Cronobacter sakazakii]NCH76716.1 right-handed parallel beta-helix repeat-containing protein [Cronobacter sakazakii]
MSFTDTSSAKKYASIAETAAAQAKLYANKLELAPNYAEQAATSATAAAASAQVAVNAEGVVNNLVVSASESATSAAESAAQAGNAAAAAVGQCVRVPEGELVDTLPSASGRASSFLLFDSAGNATVLSKDDVAILDSEGKVPVSMIPAIAITQPFVVSSQAAMLALNAQVGDVAKRTDKGFSFILSAEPASTLSNWVQLNDDVLAQLGLSSGAAQVGALDDAGVATTVQGALNLKATTASVTSTDAANRAWTNENFVDSTYKKLQTGNFATGFTITNQFQVVFYPTDGFWYRYLGTLSGGGLTLPAGSSPDSSWENINKQQMVSLRKLNELSTQSIAGYIGVNIDMPVAVKDSDNQGARVGSGVTIRNDIPTQNAVKTTKIQSAFSVYGDDISFIGVRGRGAADSDNSQTSEFITNRMAWSQGITISNTVVSRVKASGFTAGVGIYGANGWEVSDSYFTGMKYSPTTLNSAGGYGVVIGDGKNISIHDNKFIATQSDRHAVYVSVNQGYTAPATGWSNVTVRDNYIDWTGTEPANDDSKVPIHVRAGSGLFITGNRVIGGTKMVGLTNSDGPIKNVVISNNYATGIKPRAGLNGCAVSTLSASANGYQISNLEFSNNTIQVEKDASTNGLDQCARFIKVDGLRIVNNHHTIATGAGYLIQDCSNVFIDSIYETITDTVAAGTVGATTLDFEGSCSNITIGAIRTNRPLRADGKSNTVYGLPNCTDVTCLFQRYIEFTLTNGVVSLIDDAYNIISSGGVSFGTGSIQITVRNHVTDAAISGCSAYSRTANGVYVQKTAVTGKTITISFVVSNTGALQAMSTYTGRVGVTFYA